MKPKLHLIKLMTIVLAFSPEAWATCQEGCDSNSNTYLGEDALVNNTSGAANTANGAGALLANTAGNFNTAQRPWSPLLQFDRFGTTPLVAMWRSMPTRLGTTTLPTVAEPFI